MKESRANPTLANQPVIDPAASPRTLYGYESGALVVNGTAGTLTVTLPDGTAAVPAGAGVGCWFTFVKTHATNNLTLALPAANTFNDGSGVTRTSLVLTTRYRTVTIRHLGSGEWMVMDAVQVTDLTGARKTTTAEAASGGGTATGTIDLGISNGACIALRVKANGNTTDSDIQFYTATGAPAGDLVYEATGKDCYTSPYHVDGNAWAIPSWGTALGSNLIHYVITNNGANNSTYDLEMVLIGRV